MLEWFAYPAAVHRATSTGALIVAEDISHCTASTLPDDIVDTDFSHIQHFFNDAAWLLVETAGTASVPMYSRNNFPTNCTRIIPNHYYLSYHHSDRKDEGMEVFAVCISDSNKEYGRLRHLQQVVPLVSYMYMLCISTATFK